MISPKLQVGKEKSQHKQKKKRVRPRTEVIAIARRHNKE